MSRSSKGAKTCNCVVQSIDSIIALHIGGETTGQQMLDLIFNQLRVHEKHWFGLLFYDTKDNLRWLDPKKKVNLKDVKQFPDTNVHFKFTIRYFPESMKLELIQDCVKVLFFKHELSRLVTDADVECLPEHRVLYAATYACLVSHEHPSIQPEEALKKKFDRLFPVHVMKQFDLTKKDWMEAIMPPLEMAKMQHYIESVSQSLEAMQQSPMHGVSYYNISNKNGTELLLGIDCYGLTIYKTGDRVNPCLAFHWQEIFNVSYTGKAFHIRPLNKEDPELVIYTKSARQNDEILALIAGNHMNYLRRRQMDQELELEIKEATKAQEVESASRKRFEKQQEANIKYQAVVEKAICDQSEEGKQKIDEEFIKTKNMMQKQIDEARKMAEESERSKASIENEAEDLRKHAKELEERLASDQKAKEALALMESEKMTVEQEKNREIESLSKKLKELELKHAEDLRRLAEAQQAQAQAQAQMSESKPAAPTPASYDEVKKQKSADMKAHLNKVGTLMKQRNVNQDSNLTKIQENAVQGKDKFETLKLLRKNNTKARIDQFESY